MEGPSRKSQAEGIICKTEMDQRPPGSLIPTFYVTASAHGAHTCTAIPNLTLVRRGKNKGS